MSNFNDERNHNRNRRADSGPFTYTIHTWVPSKYRLIDLETGDVWHYELEGDGENERMTARRSDERWVRA